VRAALMPEYSKLPNTFGAMQKTAADVRDWEYFTYATAGAWGLSADENAMYAIGGPADAKGSQGYLATFPKVPAEAFFSITAYGPQKYLMTDSDNVVGSTAKTLADLGVTATRMDNVIPEYLWPYRPTGQYAAIKNSAKNLKKR
jgi:hypothetical protein